MVRVSMRGSGVGGKLAGGDLKRAQQGVCIYWSYIKNNTLILTDVSLYVV